MLLQVKGIKWSKSSENKVFDRYFLYVDRVESFFNIKLISRFFQKEFQVGSINNSLNFMKLLHPTNQISQIFEPFIYFHPSIYLVLFLLTITHPYTALYLSDRYFEDSMEIKKIDWTGKHLPIAIHFCYSVMELKKIFSFKKYLIAQVVVVQYTHKKEGMLQ